MSSSVPRALVGLGAILLLAGIFFYIVDQASAVLLGEEQNESSPLPDRGQAMWLMGGGVGFIGLGIFLYMRR